MTRNEWITRCACRLRSQIATELSDADILCLAGELLADLDYDTSESPESAADQETEGG